MTVHTQKIRVAVAVGPDGGWFAAGCSDVSDANSVRHAFEFIPEKSYEGAHLCWITAEIPIPTPQEIAGEVQGS